MQPKKFWLWFLVAWFVTGLPLFLLHGVPGVDTPNHVARLHVLASLQQNHSLWNFYRVHWAPLPNLAVDLLITPLVYLFKIDALLLMKVFLFNMFGITGAGFAVLNRALSGRWSAYGLLGLAFSYCYVLGFGFINYLFGIGISLLFVGCQLLLKDKPKARMTLIALGFPFLLLNHLLALVLGAMTIMIIAYWQKDKCKFLWRGFAIGSVLSLVYMKLCTTGAVSDGLRYDSLTQHVRNVIFPLYFSDLLRDVSFWLVIVGLVGFFAMRAKKQSNLGYVLLGFFSLLGLALPHMAMTSAFLSGRISIWAILVGGAAFDGIAVSPFVLLGLLLIRSGDVTSRFLTWNKTFDQVHDDLATIPDGSLVYQMVSLKANPLRPTGWYPSILHADCLLLLEKSCYVNNLFSMPFQQPLQNAPEIGPDLRDLYNRGTDKSMENNRQWLIWQLGFMHQRLQSRPVYIYFVKREDEKPFAPFGEVVVDRPRYILYRFR